MNKNYETELNSSLITFAQTLIGLDPEMNELGTIINQKLSRHEGDIMYSSLIMRTNNILQKLMECYGIIANTGGEINLCVQRIRISGDSSSQNSIIEDFPRFIRDFSDLVKEHISYVKSIKQSLIDWNGNNKAPDFIVNTDNTIFNYVNNLEGSVGFYNKITNSINEFLETNY
jgi:hypothetical protein